jgi:EAL domain-containing protein (putative c-di-GMP-specific phosphodiesterase class I)/DNA-binding NarL/FixJ family response regulator
MLVPPVENILIIDDSADFRILLRTFFKKVNPSVYVTEFDPAKGRPSESFPWSSYDLLILDYDLGHGENGLDWLRQYKTSIEFPATIMLTAKDNEELVVNAMRFGAQGFLRKAGLTKSRLIDTVHEALEKYKQDSAKASTQEIQVHLFNKEKFFGSLKSITKNDAVFLVEIDKYQSLYETLGIFGTDKFVNFFIDTISGVIKATEYQARMTRIADSTVALILANNSSPVNIDLLAEKMCEAFNRVEYKNENTIVKFSVNIGAISIVEKKPDVMEILAKVENACRKAREIPGNSCIIEDRNTAPVVLSEPDYGKEFGEVVISALTEERLKPLFQSFVLVSGTPHKDYKDIYQARAFLMDTDNNIIEPKKFLPVLGATNNLKKLDHWIVRYCAVELAKLSAGKELKIGVLIPISAQSIDDREFTDWINKLIKHVKFPGLGKSLIFEVRAIDYLSSTRQAKLQFNKLRIKLKASIALAGLNNISTLEKSLLQEKFDFVIFSPEHAGEGKMQMDQIQQFVNIAKEHKALTVACKIDSGEYLALSASAGVDYVVGHFVQPPMVNIVSTEEVVVR